MGEFLSLYGEATITAFGFFWKSAWAFILGYFISSMIQTFIPKEKLTRYMGEANFKSISLSTIFGAASSSCSFAALAAARALVKKGANFIAAVAFMFASTNLVIELGILIFIFLGWEFLAAEIIGGLVLIIISSILFKLTYPQKWLKQARKKVEKEGPDIKEDFNWKERLKSKKGWRMVGNSFVSEWEMVWEEILIGFTVAGFVAVFVPTEVWNKIFLIELSGSLPDWLVAVENAMVAPFVAALTFIGSMGNIPLATILNNNGVLFAGIMGFIYSDLMVPPLVAVNIKYYGKKVAFYIAVIMYISIVFTALILNGIFDVFNILPDSGRVVSEVARFKIDYTFYLNVFFAFLAGWLVFLRKKFNKHHSDSANEMEMEGNGKFKKLIAFTFIAVLFLGLIINFLL
ncbi:MULTISPECIES: permease [Halanaerobium]|uniref:Permease n=1 Tax=Halanaerobium kushneri TaxID=56779 RepID=A0A1N6YN37_9FIRM|nr:MULTISPECIES: permease [Halanaerobium]RCW57479.1 hypothetical protein DFR80_11279 [Halanaerobium sp. ST460_2HS_T2]SIR16015.1 hypothetical protein SAMN05421834_1153 [Halanaerobium kushneri]